MIIITVTGYKCRIEKCPTAFYPAAYFNYFGKMVFVTGDPKRTIGFAKAALAGRPIRDVEESPAHAERSPIKLLTIKIMELLK